MKKTCKLCGCEDESLGIVDGVLINVCTRCEEERRDTMIYNAQFIIYNGEKVNLVFSNKSLKIFYDNPNFPIASICFGNEDQFRTFVAKLLELCGQEEEVPTPDRDDVGLGLLDTDKEIST